MRDALRRATAADARIIARLNVEGWRGAYRRLLSDDFLDAMSVDELEAVWSRAIAHGPAEFWILERDNVALGYIILGPPRDDDLDRATTGELYAIYVLREHWGAGAGRALLAHAETRLRAAGCTRAVLWVLEENSRARRFYETAGWTSDGARKVEEVAGAPHTEVRYRTSLAAT